MSNESEYAKVLSEHGPDKLSREWVVWMLNQIDRANKEKMVINPEFLLASHNITRKTLMWITPHGSVFDSEPDWETGEKLTRLGQ